MKKEMKAIIYCRVLTNANKKLLCYQEEVLRDFAQQNEIDIVGVIKEISHGMNFCSFNMQQIIMAIQRKKIDAVIIYSQNRITTYDELFEEFEMICTKIMFISLVTKNI